MALATRSSVSRQAAFSSTPVQQRPRLASRRPVQARAAAAEVNDKTFEAEVLQSSVPVLVDFWAPWCGPCKMIAPMVDEIASEFEKTAKALKLNTDESPDTPSKYGVRSIPTVMIFARGQRQETIIGAVPKTTLVDALKKYIAE